MEWRELFVLAVSLGLTLGFQLVLTKVSTEAAFLWEGQRHHLEE